MKQKVQHCNESYTIYLSLDLQWTNWPTLRSLEAKNHQSYTNISVLEVSQDLTCISINPMWGHDPKVEELWVIGSTLIQNNADYETLLGSKCPACCFMDENNLHQQSAVELPHTNFSVKPAEKWRHYSRRSITQKTNCFRFSHRSNMHEANWQWDQIASFSLFLSPYHSRPPRTNNSKNTP